MNRPATEEETRMDAAVLARLASYKYTCVMIAAERLGLYDYLREKTTPEELAAMLGYLEQPLRRLFYALEACGMIYRDRDGWEFTHHGRRILESPNRIHQQIRGIDETMHAWLHIDEAVRRDGDLTPFHNQGGTSIWLSRAQDPARLRDFQDVMTLNVPAAFDLLVGDGRAGEHTDLLPFTGIVADVGGGTGRLLVRILDMYPQLEGMLIELPEVIQLATREAYIPERVADRINLQPANVLDEDFHWTADVSLLVNVLHDWDDSRALAILKKCAEASPRMLLIERLVRPAYEHEVAMLDLQMMAVHGGRQRSLEEYRRMGNEAGLALKTLVQGSRPTTRSMSLVEFVRC